MVTECVNIAISAIGVDWGARLLMGLGRDNVCLSTLVADVWVVPIFPCGIGNVQRSVARSFSPAKITAPLYHTSHFLLSNTTLHPALHKGRIPIRDAIFNDGTMCPVSVCGSPGIWMSHTCVDHIVEPSGKFIFSGLVAVRLLSTVALSMMNIAVAPVSAMALLAAMVSAFKYCGIGLPNMDRAVAAIEGRRCAFVVWVGRGGEQFDVTTVASSSMWSIVIDANTFNVGSKGITSAETKWLHLFA